MPTRLRKVRKFRGSRTCGWGQVSQHRESGSHGGRGNVGGHKHKWTYTVKYKADYFGKHGFRNPMSVEVSTINVGDLENIAGKIKTDQQSFDSEKRLILDLSGLGFGKLLGLGRISRPFAVKVEEHSELALKKIEEAGGQILKTDGE